MAISRLALHQFRHFSGFSLDLDPRFHVMVGRNGSGKTSLLECVYYGIYGKSFRSSQRSHLIAQDHAEMQCDLMVEVAEEGRQHIRRSLHRDGQSTLTLNGDKPKKLSLVTQCCPCVCLDTNTHRLLVGQPKWRRDCLHFCAYYLFSDYQQHWKQYQKVLEQRNRLLKEQRYSSPQELATWTQQLLHCGEKVYAQHQQCLAHINTMLARISPDITQNKRCIQLVYQHGLPENMSLAEALSAHASKEKATGHTLYGPHRADFSCQDEQGQWVFPCYSQGQLKRVAYALKLMQLELADQALPGRAVMLLDDLGAEMDSEGQRIMLEKLNTLHNQTLVTAIKKPDILGPHGLTQL